MPQPHDHSGLYFDYVFENTFGDFYQVFIDDTLRAINQIVPKGTIIDIGAGTGRLSLPLAKQGYSVIAVDQSIGMVNAFKSKAQAQNLEVPIHHAAVVNYQNGKGDLALALFTVLSYSTTEDELAANIKNICAHIEPNGYFFFDLPNTVFFNVGRLIDIQRSSLQRLVELRNTDENNVYIYSERCSGIFNEQPFSYEDEFKIRYWELETVDHILRQCGFKDTGMNFPQFQNTGSTYKLYTNK